MFKSVIEKSVQLPLNATEAAKTAELQSQHMSLVRAFFDEAVKHAKNQGLPPGSEAAWELIDRAQYVVKCVSFSGAIARMPLSRRERAELTAKEVKEIFSISHHSEANELIALARQGHRMAVDRKGFEFSIDGYLGAEFRSALADRMLLLALFDLEITCYLSEVYQGSPSTDRGITTIVAPPTIDSWLLGRSWAILRAATTLLGIGMASYLDLLGVYFALFLAFVSLTFHGLGWILSFAGYLAFCRRWKASQELLVMLPAEMVVFYSELHNTGPLVVAQVRSKAQELAAKGASWPRMLWKLLDDIESRGVFQLT